MAENKNKSTSGIIIECNPINAKVEDENGVTWCINYGLLTLK